MYVCYVAPPLFRASSIIVHHIGHHVWIYYSNTACAVCCVVKSVPVVVAGAIAGVALLALVIGLMGVTMGVT